MTAPKLSRRALLTGAVVLFSSPAWPEAPTRTLTPRYRGEWPPLPPPPPTLALLLAAAGLTGQVSILVTDAATGTVLEGTTPDLALMPASVTKAVTALYASAALGPDYRFETRLIGNGPVRDGVLDGDLILAGGGDPVLVTDDLAAMAQSLAATGLRGITGRFHVWGGALPSIRQIDPEQQPHLGYNPSLSGLNLNFNRVHFEWAQTGSDYRITMDARSDLYRPEVSMARMRVVDRELPVYTYAETDGRDDWTVARAALGEGGSRWLPVRQPEIYAGEVFRTFALAHGLDLPAPERRDRLPEGAILLSRFSVSLDDLIRDMLEYSTNLTAEVLGLTASRARGAAADTLTQSARAMTDFVADKTGATAQFVDHSGLSGGSQVSAGQMVRILAGPGSQPALQPLMKHIVLVDSAGEALENPPGDVRAKTGTLNFASTLAGYVTTPTGRVLAFAIFAADPIRRAAAQASDDEVPEGSRDWTARARALQQTVLQRWAVAYQ